MALKTELNTFFTSMRDAVRRIYFSYPLHITCILGGLAVCCLLGLAILQEIKSSDTTAPPALPLPDLHIISSPNFDERPVGNAINTVVIHILPDKSVLRLQDRIASTRSNFSVHYSIAPDGTLYEHVREDKRAWHTPFGELPDRRRQVNAVSVGIGLLQNPLMPLAESTRQLRTLRALLQQLDKKYTLKYIGVFSQVSREVRSDFTDYTFPYSAFPEYRDRFLGLSDAIDGKQNS